jgi:hypothetical protein
MSTGTVARRGRATVGLAALLASLSLAAGGQLLVPARAGAEPSNGVDCSAAIDFDACATDADDGSGITAGSGGTGASDAGPGGGTDPGYGYEGPDSLGTGVDGSGGYQDPSSGAGLSTDGGGPWGQDKGDTAAGDPPPIDVGPDGTFDPGDPDPDMPIFDGDGPPVRGRPIPHKCQPLYERYQRHPGLSQESLKALRDFQDCLESVPPGSEIARGDRRLSKSSARQHKSAKRGARRVARVGR